MEKRNLFGMCISNGTYDDFAEEVMAKATASESNYACIANVHMLVEARKNVAFAQTVNEAALITPDGKPLTWALRLVYGIRQERVAGMDLLPSLLKEAEEKRLPVFFYGGSEELLTKTDAYLKRNYPALLLAGMYAPPFRRLTMAEENAIVERINRAGAKLVFVVLGCPKQERWMASMKGRIQAFMIGVGGALPVLIGQQKRAPKWMQKVGLEWFYRLVQEPRRLFKRYAITNTVFLYLVSKAFLQKKLLGRFPQPQTFCQ